MSAPGLTIPTKFTANGDYVNNVNRMASSTDKLLGSLNRLNNVGSRAGLGLSSVTKNALSYVKSAALIGGAFATARFSVDAIMDYETAIQSLQAVTGSSDVQMVGFKKQIEELGITSKKSGIDIAKSFETVGSMMSQYLDDPKALRQITEAGITLSKASRMELEPALESLTSVMNQFQLKAESANKTIQTLTAGEIVGAIRTSEASSMLQEFGAVASNMNVNVGESVALIEALGMQMDKTKIGVGARNILTIIGAAGGLDKKARKDLRGAGVDMNYLMDKTHSLSDRLHELSKIAKDPIKMVSVFGKENVTAGNVIFNQLATYDKFYNKIQTTAEAEHQAAVNSKTLSIAIDQLKNKWVNLLNSSSDVGAGLNKVRDVLFYVADNMETIISVGGKLIGGFLLWKGAILAVRAATMAYIGVSQAFFLVDMVRYISVTKGITMATAGWEIAMASLNGTMLLNPAFLIVAGIVAVGAAMYLAYQKTEQLTAAYKKQIEIDMVRSIDNETSAVKKLAVEYYLLHGNIKKATTEAIKFRMNSIDYQRNKVESRISETKVQLQKENDKIYLGDLFLDGDRANYGKRAELQAQLAAQQGSAAQLAGSKVSELQFLQQQTASGMVNKNDFAGMFGNKKETASVDPYRYQFADKPEENKNWTKENLQSWLFDGDSEQKKNFRFNEAKPIEDKKSKMEIIISNQSGGTVDVKSGQTSNKSVMPNTKSSFSTK